MSEQKPEAVWVFPEKKRNGGRIALIIALVVVVLLIAAGLALFLIPRHDGAPSTDPTSSASPTPSSSSASPSASPSDSPAPSPSTATPPPPPDPSIAAFRDQVGFRLDTATQGLDMIAQGDPDSANTVNKLEGDAQRLSDTAPPSSIASDWRSALQTYASRLQDLSQNTSDANALSGARDAVATMKRLIGA